MSKIQNNGKPSVFYSSTLKSPVGSALFPAIAEPDSYKGGEPFYKVTLIFEEDSDQWAEIKGVFTDFAKTYSKEIGKTVTADSVLKTDTRSGKPCITFKSKARQGDNGNFLPMVCVDGTKAATDAPQNGDQVCVAYTLGGWSSAFGSGIKPYLSAVQVISRRPAFSKTFAVDVFDAVSTEDCPF